MKIFVIVDMEGISGICRKSQVEPGGAHYGEGRLYTTLDVNACVEGCFAGGARKVVVQDAHCSGYNFLWDRLDSRAEYIQGVSPGERMPGIESCDGLILLGYHSMAGTVSGLLEHTWNSKKWQNFWMNGRKAGEIGIDSAIAGEQGVPTIMVSGDDKACREARAFIKGVVTSQVKVGLGLESARLLSAEKARALIASRVAEAVGKCETIKPVKTRRPVKMRLELVSRGKIPATDNNPWFKVIDGRTYEVTGRTVAEAMSRL